MANITINYRTQRGHGFITRRTQKNEVEVFCLLREAYCTTTRACNRFKEMIDCVAWDTTFDADGETYYCANGFTLTVESVNPFDEVRKPSVMFSDGSMMEIA